MMKNRGTIPQKSDEMKNTESVGFEPTCPVKDNRISSALLSMDFTGIYLILAGFDGS